MKVHGRTVKVRTFVIDALWYRAGRSELLRFVVVRDFPGHDRDDVFVATDPSMDAESIIETFSRRWSPEHTFHEGKGKLGFEDPQNRKDHAVERTAPMALWLHTLAGVREVPTHPNPMPLLEAMRAGAMHAATGDADERILGARRRGPASSASPTTRSSTPSSPASTAPSSSLPRRSPR